MILEARALPAEMGCPAPTMPLAPRWFIFHVRNVHGAALPCSTAAYAEQLRHGPLGVRPAAMAWPWPRWVEVK